MTTLQFEGVTSGASDIRDLPLDEVIVNDIEYARIMRRISADGGTDTDVSAFNSSI